VIPAKLFPIVRRFLCGIMWRTMASGYVTLDEAGYGKEKGSKQNKAYRDSTFGLEPKGIA
jgi:hypothetical protein